MASKSGGQKTLFKYEIQTAANPYDSKTPFRSDDSAARQALWESKFYSDWKESYNGVLEPTKFRGEENIVCYTQIAGQKNNRHCIF